MVIAHNKTIVIEVEHYISTQVKYKIMSNLKYLWNCSIPAIDYKIYSSVTRYRDILLVFSISQFKNMHTVFTTQLSER